MNRRLFCTDTVAPCIIRRIYFPGRESHTSVAINGIIRSVIIFYSFGYLLLAVTCYFVTCNTILPVSHYFVFNYGDSPGPAGVQKSGYCHRESDRGGKTSGAAPHSGHRGSVDQLLRDRLQGHGLADCNSHTILVFSFSFLRGRLTR